jgi:hypothetical protein
MTVTIALVFAALLLAAGTAIVFLTLWTAERLDRATGSQRPTTAKHPEHTTYREAA